MEVVNTDQRVNFSWTWSNFESSRTASFRELRDAEELFDVTLCCDNGVDIVKAHRLVLAACSTLFRRILAHNKHQSMFLYLKGVHREELERILDFMYNGRVSVEQSALTKLLAVAGELGVKGFSALEKSEQRSSINSNSISNKIIKAAATKTSKRKVNTTVGVGIGDDKEIEALTKKTKMASSAVKVSTVSIEEQSTIQENLQAISVPKLEPRDPVITYYDEASINQDASSPHHGSSQTKTRNAATKKVPAKLKEQDKPERTKQPRLEPNDSSFTDVDPTMDSVTGEPLEKVRFLKSKRGFPVLVDSLGYTYLMSNKKSDHLYWVCQRAKLENCRGTVITKGFNIAKRNVQHCHSPTLPSTRVNAEPFSI